MQGQGAIRADLDDQRVLDAEPSGVQSALLGTAHEARSSVSQGLLVLCIRRGVPTAEQRNMSTKATAAGAVLPEYLKPFLVDVHRIYFW